MSIQVLGWALEYQDLPLDNRTGRPSPSAKLVLIALANHADRDGANCFPSVDTICWYTGLSERAVQYTLRELENHGTIRKTPNPLVLEVKVGDPRKRPQSYDIVPSAATGAAPHDVPKRRSRGAKSTGSRGAKSAASLHPNRPLTVLTPEPSVEGSRHSVPPSTWPLTVEDPNIARRGCSPPPRQRGAGLHELQDPQDETDGSSEVLGEKINRLLDFIHAAVPGGLEPNEIHAVTSMLKRNTGWRKAMGWVGKHRGYDREYTQGLIQQAARSNLDWTEDEWTALTEQEWREVPVF